MWFIDLDLLCQNTKSNKAALGGASWIRRHQYAVFDHKTFAFSSHNMKYKGSLHCDQWYENDLLRK